MVSMCSWKAVGAEPRLLRWQSLFDWRETSKAVTVGAAARKPARATYKIRDSSKDANPSLPEQPRTNPNKPATHKPEQTCYAQTRTNWSAFTFEDSFVVQMVHNLDLDHKNLPYLLIVALQ